MGDELWSDPVSMRYHQKQYLAPKASTLKFIDDIQGLAKTTSRILDIGCGAGAATRDISRAFPGTEFWGIDSDPNLVDLARKSIDGNNVNFKVGDVYKLEKENFEGVISLEVLSWLPDYEKPLEEIVRQINPRWIAITSLFYPGQITAKTIISEHSREREINYNTYSLPKFSNFCASLGYRMTFSSAFNFPFDLPMPETTDLMGTYTLKTVEQNIRLQISGPILMNWMTVFLEKEV